MAAVLVCAVTVLAAAAPGVALAVHDLSQAQDRADSTALTTRAIVLAHSLADERDGLAAQIAAGHTGSGGASLPAADRTRVDRQVEDVTADAPAGLRTALATLPAVRRTALTAQGGPQSVITAYQPLLTSLGQATGPVTAPLSRAVAAAAVQRGLLVGALTGDGPQSALVAAAQVAHVQEQAALAEFRSTAPADQVESYDQTVTGADTAAADHDLGVLLDQPQLTDADRALGSGPVNSALTARIGLMRGVEAADATDEAHTAAAARDHDVTVLELRAALAALCLLLLVGVLVTVFRGLTRPLAALHRWSRADAESGQGVEVIGADEFAAVARRANALTHEAHALRARTAELGGEHTRALAARASLAAERDALLRRQEDLVQRLAAASAQGAAQSTYINLGLRTLGLVERQLTLIEGLEEHEQEPERLETLFKLDHLATRMRRNSENLLVLTGTEHSHGAAARPVPVLDVARAALSEIERYERVRIQVLPDVRIAGRAADDISHLLAELLDNATAFSAPAAEVHLSGWLLESGEVMFSVEDSGIGVPPDRADELNALLADTDPTPPGNVSGMGLYVVARLAHRHGLRVQLRPQKMGGTTAVVVVPRLLLTTPGPDDELTTAVEAAIAGEPLPTPSSSPAASAAHPHPAGQQALADLGLIGQEDGVSPLSPLDPALDVDPFPAPKDMPPVAVPAQREHARPRPVAPADPAGYAAPAEGLTAKGLPQRMPRSTGRTGEAAPPAAGRTGPVDADALRRQLGGLQRGLHAGRRDAEREITTGTGPVASGPASAPPAQPAPSLARRRIPTTTASPTSAVDPAPAGAPARAAGPARAAAPAPASAADPAPAPVTDWAPVAGPAAIPAADRSPVASPTAAAAPAAGTAPASGLASQAMAQGDSGPAETAEEATR
ncbi:nitrate- and nitrite sensing domain-containing protein [Streptomyces sp. NPDC051976]|uniref:nitrate- and nitrite sensing domain-containing protein n=1 Tax=Streptomyces sp. NPDC051976 TaxID=3154947 RepID=UPI003419E17C